MQTRELVKHRDRLAKAARFAAAAYNASGQYAWHYGSARGCVVVEDSHLIIAIAGTDDEQDMMMNVSVSPREMGDWSFAAGIPISRDSQKVTSTVGFLDYAANAYEGIASALRRHQYDPNKMKRVTLVGHSLGGAAAYLLQHTKCFEEAEAVAFGSPRPFKRGSLIPSRLRFRAWRHTDLIPYVPLSCVHPDAVQFIVSGKGRVPQTKIHWQQTPAVLAQCVIAWGWGVLSAINNLLGRHPDFHALFAGHSMNEYRESLTVEGPE